MTSDDDGLRGHRRVRRGASPFAPVLPSVALVLAYTAAALVWVAAGNRLPGGRWLAVHLFTLGVLTNAVVAFTQHFGRTLTRAPEEPLRGVTPLLNVGLLGVLVGLPTQQPWAVAAGATVVTGAVTAAWWRLRRMRRHALGSRFGWIVRLYERAHGAFVHGAVLGLLLGLGVLPGAWHVSARLAHLHVNILGWGGLTLLATMVFFGPTVVRGRIRPGADRRAALLLPWAATALTAAVLALLGSGAGGAVGTAARLLAAAGLAVFAAVATVVILPVVRVAATTDRSPLRWSLLGVCGWLLVAVWADAAVVALDRPRLLAAVGAAGLVGVLAQAVALTVTYVTVPLRGRSAAARNVLHTRAERLPRLRAAGYNAGVLAIVTAAAGAPAGFGAAGWGLLAAALVGALLPLVWPVSAAP